MLYTLSLFVTSEISAILNVFRGLSPSLSEHDMRHSLSVMADRGEITHNLTHLCFTTWLIISLSTSFLFDYLTI